MLQARFFAPSSLVTKSFDESLSRKWIYLAVYVAVSFLMSARGIGSSPDDLDYLNYFSSVRSQVEDVFAFSEPLWDFYTATMALMFSPEYAFRITIFAANFIFLWAASSIAGWRGGYVFIIYILNFYLATLFFYIQIRFGFAVAIFLGLLRLRVKFANAALFCAALHAAFVVVFVAALLSRMLAASRVLRAFFLVALISLSVVLYQMSGEVSFLATLDLGRREGVYEFGVASNLNFYLLSILLFFSTRPRLYDWVLNGHVGADYKSEFIVFYLVSVIASLVSESGIRLVAIANVLLFLPLGAGQPNSKYLINRGFVLLIHMLLVLNEYLKGNFGIDSWFVRWALIFS